MGSYNKLHGVFPSFSPLNPELNPDSRIIDIFQDRFSFNLASKAKNGSACSQQLNNITILSSMSPHMAIVISDASIKNDIATSVLHIHIWNNPLIKTVYHAAYITSTKAELLSLSLPTPPMWPKRFLISSCIHIKSTWQLSSMNFSSSLLLVKEITLNFGNALITNKILTGCNTWT